MIISIHQPHYLPWAGYLDKIDRSDCFILLDTVQFQKGEWQNRNRFKTSQGPQWITVPVLHDFGQSIMDVLIDPNQSNWTRKHRQAFQTHYGSSPHFDLVAERLESIWEQQWERLSLLNRATLEILLELTGIDIPLYWASEFDTVSDHPDERLISICRQLQADTYLAGTAGPSYMELKRWEEAGIDVVVQNFVHPEYTQLFGEFIPAMSVVDLLCNCGQRSLTLLREANGRETLP